MFCLHCRRVEPEATASRANPTGEVAITGELAGSVVRCRRCGSTLLGAEVMETMLRKLEQLDQFGLTREGSPLLARRRAHARG